MLRTYDVERLRRFDVGIQVTIVVRVLLAVAVRSACLPRPAVPALAHPERQKLTAIESGQRVVQQGPTPRPQVKDLIGSRLLSPLPENPLSLCQGTSFPSTAVESAHAVVAGALLPGSAPGGLAFRMMVQQVSTKAAQPM